MNTQTAMQKIGDEAANESLRDDLDTDSLDVALDDDLNIDEAEIEEISLDDMELDDDIDDLENEDESTLDGDDEEKPVEKVKIFDDNGVEITLELDDTEIDEALLHQEEKLNVFSKNPFNYYLADLSKFPLLTKEQEVLYGDRIQAAIEDGGMDIHARDMLINSNLRLVISIAKRYIGAGGNIGIGDLVAWGNVGLMEAVIRFKPEYGYRFSTYATWWIKQAVQRKIADIRNTIRKPVHMYQLEYRYRKIISKIEPGLTLSDEDIIKEMKCTPLQLERVREAFKVNASISLDMPTSNSDGENMGPMIDTIVDENGKKADTDFYNQEMVNTIERLLIILSEREATVLKFRFGINCNEHTLEETGKHFGVTRERIRQIEKIALKKLRRHISLNEKDVRDIL